jgi:hypothetical protein
MHTSTGPATGESAGPGSAGRWRTLTGPRSSTGAWTRWDVTIGRRMELDRTNRPSPARAGPTLSLWPSGNVGINGRRRLHHVGGLAADEGGDVTGIETRYFRTPHAPTLQVPGVTRGLSGRTKHPGSYLRHPKPRSTRGGRLRPHCRVSMALRTSGSA